MTSTSQPDPAKEAPASSAGQATEAKTDAKTVPLGEHIELRQELRALKDELAKLQASAAKPNTGSPTSQPASADQQAMLQQIARKQQERDLADELGVNVKQAAAVADLLSKSPDLTPAEAKSLAASRNPDLFGAAGGSGGFQPGIHGTARPNAGGPQPTEPKPSPFDQRIAEIKALGGKNRQLADNAFMNLVGRVAAQQVGITDHQLMPLPKTR